MFEVGDRVRFPYFSHKNMEEGTIIRIDKNEDYENYDIAKIEMNGRFRSVFRYLSEVELIQKERKETMDIEVGDEITVKAQGKVLDANENLVLTKGLDGHNYTFHKQFVTHVKKNRPISKGDRVCLRGSWSQQAGIIRDVIEGTLEKQGELYYIVIWDHSGAPAVLRQQSICRVGEI